MIGPIEIFNRNNIQQTQADDTTIDEMAKVILSSVAGNDQNTAKVKAIIEDVKQKVKTEGQSRAMQYMATAYTQLA